MARGSPGAIDGGRNFGGGRARRGGLALASDLTGGPPLGAGDFVLLALLPIAAVVLATLVARFAVLSALHKII